MPDNPVTEWIELIGRMPETQALVAQIKETEDQYVTASIRLLEALGYTVTGPGR
jgi:hypothetical protein